MPTAMVLSRQVVPTLAETASKARDGVRRGAYVLVDTEGTPDVILMGTGSEVQLAIEAAQTLASEGIQARVVSMPSFEWFEEQTPEYREAQPWYKYLGSFGKPVSVECFGLQGEGMQNLKDLGITAEHVVDAAKASIDEVQSFVK